MREDCAKFHSDESADTALCHEGRPVFGVGGIVVAHSGKRGRVILDWRTLATGATARPRACVPLKNQHQLCMLRNGGAAPWQSHSH